MHCGAVQCTALHSVTPLWFNLLYDTIRYIYVRSTADDMASLRHKKRKNNGKTRNKNRVAQKKRSGEKSVTAVQEEEVKLREGKDLLNV